MGGPSAAGGSKDDPPKDEQVIEDAIRGAAGRKHVSIARLAKDAHVQRQTIYNWFDGVVPEPETWGRVAARLDLPPLADLLARHTATETPDALITALTAQTQAINALVAALGGELSDRLGTVEAEMRLLLPLLGPGGRPARSSPPSKAGSTGGR